MDLIDTKNKLTSIYTHIANKELREAISSIRDLIANRVNWSLLHRTDELEDNYRYMIHYFLSGNKDPEQRSIYQKLIRDLYILADDAARETLIHDSASFYYEKMRMMQVDTPPTFSDQRETVARESDTYSFIELLEDGSEKERRIRKNRTAYESAIQNLFYNILTSPRADSNMSAELRHITQDDRIPSHAKAFFVSALTMNLMHQFDAPKMEILLDYCIDSDLEVSTRAIVGIIPLIQIYSERWPLHPEIESRMKLLADDKEFTRRLMTAITGYIQANKTEEISRQLNEEILPEMMKLSPMIGTKIRFDEWMGESGLDEKNPEWQKLLDDSGLTNKLQAFSNLQMEGADILHSTFSSLKNYPFFHEMCNWFLPFEPQHSSISVFFKDMNETGSLIDTMIRSSAMCNSDKYSLCLSMIMMPKYFRKMIISQLSADEEDVDRMLKEEQLSSPHHKEETLIRHYIRDLYRFFKLFRRRKEFNDIFNLPLNFHELEPIAPIVQQPTHLEEIALYYFEKNNFTEALSAYSLLAKQDNSKNEVWQKIGYCRQMLADTQGALDAYLHAELLDEQNSWVLHRIASCYRVLKEPESALIYYRRLEPLRSDDLNLQLQIGHCHLELKQYETALNYYFKVELLDSRNTRAQRSIAWCAFLSRKFDVAQNYYKRILKQQPDSHDFLNAGHVELCLGNHSGAVKLYNMSQEQAGSFENFRTLLEGDMDELEEAGVDTEILPIILDGMHYGNDL